MGAKMGKVYCRRKDDYRNAIEVLRQLSKEQAMRIRKQDKEISRLIRENNKLKNTIDSLKNKWYNLYRVYKIPTATIGIFFFRRIYEISNN